MRVLLLLLHLSLPMIDLHFNFVNSESLALSGPRNGYSAPIFSGIIVITKVYLGEGKKGLEILVCIIMSF